MGLTPDDKYRIEEDYLGEMYIPCEAYYGINTARAFENFSVSGRKTNMKLINSMIIVKKASAMAHKKLEHFPLEISEAIIEACDDILKGGYEKEFVVDALQGGAGTSTNMNVNEVIANRAIEILGGKKGDYDKVNPLHHVNCCQSTNDVYPTALRIAAIKLLRPLSEAFAELQEAIQEKEHEFADILKLGRTELMDALPMMLGQGFGAYAKAIARDRWRLYKVEERLREINIGGTAIGTGMNASRKYIFAVTDILQEITGLGVARSEYPMDITQNMDVFVEVSGLLKSAAVNLMKISNDLRLLSSGPAGGIGEIHLPSVQAGSSIMPGKVNPVIPEMVAQVSMKVIANDSCITLAAANGQMELNAFTPIIAETLLESLEIMKEAVNKFKEACIKEIKADEKVCRQYVDKSTVLATALVHYIGYDRAAEIAKKAQMEGISVREAVMQENLLDENILDRVLDAYQVTKPGIPGQKG